MNEQRQSIRIELQILETHFGTSLILDHVEDFFVWCKANDAQRFAIIIPDRNIPNLPNLSCFFGKFTLPQLPIAWQFKLLSVEDIPHDFNRLLQYNNVPNIYLNSIIDDGKKFKNAISKFLVNAIPVHMSETALLELYNIDRETGCGGTTHFLSNDEMSSFASRSLEFVDQEDGTRLRILSTDSSQISDNSVTSAGGKFINTTLTKWDKGLPLLGGERVSFVINPPITLSREDGLITSQYVESFTFTQEEISYVLTIDGNQPTSVTISLSEYVSANKYGKRLTFYKNVIAALVGQIFIEQETLDDDHDSEAALLQQEKELDDAYHEKLESITRYLNRLREKTQLTQSGRVSGLMNEQIYLQKEVVAITTIWKKKKGRILRKRKDTQIKIKANAPTRQRVNAKDLKKYKRGKPHVRRENPIIQQLINYMKTKYNLPLNIIKQFDNELQKNILVGLATEAKGSGDKSQVKHASLNSIPFITGDRISFVMGKIYNMNIIRAYRKKSQENPNQNLRCYSLLNAQTGGMLQNSTSRVSSRPSSSVFGSTTGRRNTTGFEKNKQSAIQKSGIAPSLHQLSESRSNSASSLHTTHVTLPGLSNAKDLVVPKNRQIQMPEPENPETKEIEKEIFRNYVNICLRTHNVDTYAETDADFIEFMIICLAEIDHMNYGELNKLFMYYITKIDKEEQEKTLSTILEDDPFSGGSKKQRQRQTKAAPVKQRETVTYHGHQYVVHKGTRGGKYIVCGDKKVYLGVLKVKK